MKVCTKCSESKSEEEFPFRSKAKGTRHRWCKMCMNVESAKKYMQNRAFLAFYLRTHPCVECGEDDPLVLEFDHVDGKAPGDKSVSSLTNASRRTILAEIDKCQVLCANCHTRKTRIQMGWRDYHTMVVEIGV